MAISDAVKQSSEATISIEQSVCEISIGTEQAGDRVKRLAQVSSQISELAGQLEQRARSFKI